VVVLLLLLSICRIGWLLCGVLGIGVSNCSEEIVANRVIIMWQAHQVPFRDFNFELITH
jgi:hypothetical protein